MVKLFNFLQMGSPVAKAAGGRLNKPDLRLSDTIRSFSTKAEILQPEGSKKVEMRFKIPFLPRNERLRLAEFRCLRKKSRNVRTKKYKIKIDIFKGGSLVSKFAFRTPPFVHAEYDVFDVSRALTPWINGYHGNVTINIKLPLKYTKTLSKNKSKKADSLIVFYLEDDEFLKNMYESYTAEERASKTSSDVMSRGKRASRGKNRRHRKNRRWNKAGKREGCHVYDFDVDFNTIGWGQWIIHPKRFNSKVCYGSCPSPIDIRYKPTNHAMLQSLMRTKRSNSAPVPCCVPTKLKALSMLYFEYDEIVVRHHEDMIADECGCR
ncbi:nodal homolog [Haliotis cracherodii]|uniref:nodal homolog n=2 Tax=Haliotis TaxID=6452 RepID=UPI0039EB4A2E